MRGHRTQSQQKIQHIRWDKGICFSSLYQLPIEVPTGYWSSTSKVSYPRKQQQQQHQNGYTAMFWLVGWCPDHLVILAHPTCIYTHARMHAHIHKAFILTRTSSSSGFGQCCRSFMDYEQHLVAETMHNSLVYWSTTIIRYQRNSCLHITSPSYFIWVKKNDL